MKRISKAILSMALGLAVIVSSGAQAQTSAETNGTNTNSSQSGALNQGVSNTNNFESSADTNEHVHYSGVTGSNTPVGLGSFSSSFSSDYCGGTAQGGISVPYVTTAFGKPVLGDPGVACVDIRAAVHTMEFAATFGNAADRSLVLAAKYEDLSHPKVGSAVGTDYGLYTQEASAARQAAFNYAQTSQQLATAAIYMQCNLSDDVRKAYRDAGFVCPKTDAEKKADADAAAQQQASTAHANNEPTDPLVRQRLGLPPLQ
jgi:hypothetical protein